jgi:acetyl esterase/lipase
VLPVSGGTGPKQEIAIMQRRELLKSIGAGVVAGAVSSRIEAAAVEEKPVTRTYVYKKAGDCEIKADVHGAATAGSRRPVIVNIHGGALIMGNRFGLRRELFDPHLERGCVVVSIDYRLAPETKLPAIIDDVRDAFRWVRDRGPDLFGADPDRIGVHGGSAGGYLTLMTGICIEPRPRALVSYFGYGDIIGDWYAKPDSHYNKGPRVDEKTARAAIADHAISQPPPGKRRGDFYLYCRQNGLWPKEVTGFDPHTQAEAFKPYCPVRNVTPEYPPTLLCHGTADTDVPYAQSVQMAHEFARVGVPFEFIPLHNAGHGFGGANPKALRSAIERSIAFFEHYV